MSFWIKRDKSLTSKPEVLQIASRLNIDRWSAAGRCEDVWSWADEHTENGHASGVTKVFIDQLVACDGFADAMVLVGWLHIDSNGVTIPNFDRHNGKSAKKRASDAERQKKSRDKSRKECDKNHDEGATRSLSVSDFWSLISSLLPEEMQTEKMRAAWLDWEQHRKERKPRITKTSAGKQAKKLAEMGHDRAIAAIEHSIAGGYQGIFEPNPGRGGGANRTGAGQPGNSRLTQREREAARGEFPETGELPPSL